MLSTALSRILCAAVIGGTAAGVGTLYAAVQPVEGQPHAAPQPVACWVEKATSQDAAEAVCGDPALRPAGSLDIGQEVTLRDHVWVATITGLEPVEEV